MPDGADEFRDDCRYGKSAVLPVVTHGIQLNIIFEGIGVCEDWVKVRVDDSSTEFWVINDRVTMPL